MANNYTVLAPAGRDKLNSYMEDEDYNFLKSITGKIDLDDNDKKKKNEIINNYAKKCNNERKNKNKHKAWHYKQLYHDSKKEKERYSKFKFFSKFGIVVFIVLTLVLIILIFTNVVNCRYWVIICVILSILLGASVSSWHFCDELAEKSRKICEISEDAFEMGKYPTCNVTDMNWIHPYQDIRGNFPKSPNS